MYFTSKHSSKYFVYDKIIKYHHLATQ